MSKKRDRAAFQEVKLCLSTTRGEHCPYGSECRFSHDLRGYLEQKGPDIGPNCYMFDKYGTCPHGIACRFGSSHIDKEKGVSITKENAVTPEAELNVLSKELQAILRKKKYPPAPKTNETKDDNRSEKATSDIDVERLADSSPTVPAVDLRSEVSTGNKMGAPDGYSKPYPNKVKLVDFSNKVYIAPLTTVGNLPFRRVLKDFGADITCGEMAIGYNLHQGQSSEWALLRRHRSEDVFGIQVAGARADQMAEVARIIDNETVSDFVDLNCGCPIDVVCDRGAGSALMTNPKKLCNLITAISRNLTTRCMTVKIRTGWDDKAPTAHKLIPQIQKIANGRIAAIMIHGRSRLQRYTRLANWDYILEATRSQDPTLDPLPVIGNGDIFSWEDWRDRQQYLRNNMDGDDLGLCDCAMIGRGALVKPWLPREIKSSQHIDISASERFEMLQNFVNYGLEHWGSDDQGVRTTRRFLLEWLSYLHRYVPFALLENPPQKINIRPNLYIGRSDTETLLGSSNPKDWIKISELLLGPVHEGFSFTPKHQSNSYSSDRDGESNVRSAEPTANPASHAQESSASDVDVNPSTRDTSLDPVVD